MRNTFIALLLLLAPAVQAQNAKTILDKVSDTYSNAGGITASFSINSEDIKNKTTYSQDGKVYMDGEKFKIDMPDGTTWFDGTNQWVYMKEADEVSITSPSKEDLQSLSPMAMLDIYKVGFELVYKGEKLIDGKTVIEIDILPTTKTKQSSDITKISVLIDKTSNIFSRIAITDKSGFLNVLTIKNIKKGVKLEPSLFQFNKALHPNVEIIDLQ